VVLSALYKALYGSPTAPYRWALFAITEVEKLNQTPFGNWFFLPDTDSRSGIGFFCRIQKFSA